MPSDGPPTFTSAFRSFSTPSVHGGRRVALGRNHASWFLIFSQPEGQRCRRATQCLNFVALDDASTVGVTSPAGAPRFTIGGTTGPRVLKDLLALRDEAGLPVAVIAEGADRKRFDWMAVVEVALRAEEVAYACARCGKWEVEGRPRFFPCGQCNGRYYCGAQCSLDDWQTHHVECEFLVSGQAHLVEKFRRTHDNGWWFDHGLCGTTTMLIGSGKADCERAQAAGDDDFFVYGRRDALKENLVLPAPPPAHIPPIPALPTPYGFNPTGDPALDEALLVQWFATRGTDSERKGIRDLMQRRQAVIKQREAIMAREVHVKEEA